MKPRAFRFFSLLRLGLAMLALATSTLAFALPPALEEWLQNEQTLLDRTVNSSRILPPSRGDQGEAYLPESQQWFDLPSVWVPESELDVAQLEHLIPRQLRSEFVRRRAGQTFYRLFIHPESQDFYRSITDRYPVVIEHQATSTASSRTLLARSKSRSDRVFFAKLSLDRELGGVRRTIPAGEIARSIGTTQYLESLDPSLSSEFGYLPEVLGIIPRGWARGGQIIRIIPESILQNTARLVPLFSLTASRPQGSLLEEMLRNDRSAEGAEFVRNQILRPFIRGWVRWAVHGSVVMEAHAQNVLLEIDASGMPTGRFAHRDMGGFNIDSDSPLVDAELLESLPTIRGFEEDYHQPFTLRARTQSLYTYFEGGVLFNLELDLKRMDPSYRRGTLSAAFWRDLVDELASVAGTDVGRIRRLMWSSGNRRVNEAPRIAKTLHWIQKRVARRSICERAML